MPDQAAEDGGGQQHALPATHGQEAGLGALPAAAAGQRVQAAPHDAGGHASQPGGVCGAGELVDFGNQNCVNFTGLEQRAGAWLTLVWRRLDGLPNLWTESFCAQRLRTLKVSEVGLFLRRDVARNVQAHPQIIPAVPMLPLLTELRQKRIRLSMRRVTSPHAMTNQIASTNEI